MYTLTKAITHYARQRLYTLQHQLQPIDNLLPQDESFDKSNVRHKRFVEILFPLIHHSYQCSLRENHTNHLEIQYQKISEELEHYKTEYARLYQDTMPEIVPEYIEQNSDFLDSKTVLQEAKELERQTRDVQFLINIINLETNRTTTPAPPTPSTTPKPQKFEILYYRKFKE